MLLQACVVQIDDYSFEIQCKFLCAIISYSHLFEYSECSDIFLVLHLFNVPFSTEEKGCISSQHSYSDEGINRALCYLLLSVNL